MKLLLLSCLVVLAAAVPRIADVEWGNWKQANGKMYEDTKTEHRRYSIWKANHVMIDEHNKDADKHGYEQEVNPFTDLTSEEFVAMFNGYKMATNTTSDTFKATPGFIADDNVDWRTKGAVTPIKNQGQVCGSCWSFSATGSLEGQHFLKTGDLVPLSEQNLMDCSRLEGDHSCKGGLMDDAFKYIIKNGGIDTEESYPYQAHDELRCKFTKANIGATMSSYKDIERGDVNALMQAIDQIGPISVAMDASRPSFHNYKRGVYSDRSCSSKKLDHGVLAVGYGTYEGTPYFLVKNSWGAVWGDEGYFMIERSEENMCGLATQASYPIV